MTLVAAVSPVLAPGSRPARSHANWRCAPWRGRGKPILIRRR